MKTVKLLNYQFPDQIRLDKFLAEELNLTRSKVTALVNNEKVVVNNKNVKPSHLLKQGDEIHIILEETNEATIQSERIPLDIIYEDNNFLIVNKPRGMLVHPAGKVITGTLVNALLNHTKDLSSHYGIERAGIVHRIDKDTSGLLIVTKNDSTHQFFANLFSSRKIEKYYFALVEGVFPQDKAKIFLPIEKDPRNRMVKISPTGKYAATDVLVMERFEDYTLLEVRIHTGRTHQIRIHLSHIGHPVVGDPVYGKREERVEGQLLHSYKISFPMPVTEEMVTFTSPLPEDFSEFLETIRSPQ